MFAGNRVASARSGQGRQRRSSVWATYAGAGLAVACLVSACEPELIVGIWSAPSEAGGTSGAGGAEGGFGGGGVAGAVNGGTLAGGAGNGGNAGIAGLGGTAGSTAGGTAGDTGGDGSAGELGAGAGGVGGCDLNAPVGPITDPIVVPWQTGFENDICDYVETGGYCYVRADASYAVVTTPARTGNSAAAFTVNAAEPDSQTRCVRQGTLPPDAYYGAWFYVPTAPEQVRLWNLYLFQGDKGGPDLDKLWDVSLGTSDTGGLALFVFDHRRGEVLRAPDGVEIPIGAWFHVEFRLLRAADETGLVALYQDDMLLIETRRPTDDTSWGQWYVGNLAEGLSPPDSTIYVDDVSIRAAP